MAQDLNQISPIEIDVKDLWLLVLKKLNNELGNEIFNSWIKNIKVQSIDDDILYLKNVNTLNLRKNNYISDLSPLIKTKKLDIRNCRNIRILPKKNIIDYIDVSRDNYYANLINLNINNLNIKKIDIDNYS